jgi:tetratricopeptide (TPR) repeat protein
LFAASNISGYADSILIHIFQKYIISVIIALLLATKILSNIDSLSTLIALKNYIKYVIIVLLINTNMLDFIDRLLINLDIENLTKKFTSLIQFIINFIVLIVLIRLITFPFTKSEEIIILPFEVNTSNKKYNGRIISDSLIAELRKIEKTHSFKFEEKEDILCSKISLPKLAPNTESSIYLPKLTPETESFETKISNIGSLTFAGTTLPIGGVLTIFNKLLPLGGSDRIIKGSLQEYGSEIHLIVLMEGPKPNEWNKIEKSANDDKIPESIKDLAFMITYDLSKEQAKKKRIKAKTWNSLRYYTDALYSYYQYEDTKDIEHLKNARKICIKALEEDKEFQTFFTLYHRIGTSFYETENYFFAEDAFRHCTTLMPNNENGFIGLGVALLKLRRYQEALEAFDKALEIQESLESFEKAPQTNAIFADAWYNKGLTLVKLCRYELASDAFDKALEIKQKSKPEIAMEWYNASYNKGLTLFRCCQYEEALKAFEEALNKLENARKKKLEKVKRCYNSGLNLKNYRQKEAFEEALKIKLESKLELEEIWYNASYYKGLTLLILCQLKPCEKISEEIKKVLTIGQEDADLWYNKGLAPDKFSQGEEAKKVFKETRKIKPEDIDVWYNKGLILRKIDQKEEAKIAFEEALKACKETLKVNHEDVDAWYNKGLIHDKLGQGSKASKAFKKAWKIQKDLNKLEKRLKMGSEDTKAWYNTGLIHLKLGKEKKAKNAFRIASRGIEKTLKVNPDDMDVWYNLGLIYYKLQNKEKGLIAFKKALKIQKEKHLEATLEIQKDLEAFERPLKIKPEFVYIKDLTLISFNRLKKDLEASDQALKIKLEFADAWYNKGLILCKIGRKEEAKNAFEEALKAFEKSLEVQPEDVNTWYNKGVILSKLGGDNEALEAFMKSLVIRSKNVNTWYNKGIIHGKLGEDKEALEAFVKSLEIRSEDADEWYNAWYNTGLTLFKLRRYKDAKDAYKVAHKIRPNFAEALFNESLALGNLGRYKDALKVLNDTLDEVKKEPQFEEEGFNKVTLKYLD